MRRVVIPPREAHGLRPGVRRHGGAAPRRLATRSPGGRTGVVQPWHDGAWRQWYTAVWAEAAVLAALPDRRPRLDRARFVPVRTGSPRRSSTEPTPSTRGHRRAPGRSRRPRRRRVPLSAGPHSGLRRRRRARRRVGSCWPRSVPHRWPAPAPDHPRRSPQLKIADRDRLLLCLGHRDCRRRHLARRPRTGPIDEPDRAVFCLRHITGSGAARPSPA